MSEQHLTGVAVPGGDSLNYFIDSSIFSPVVPKLGVRAPPKAQQINQRGREMINERKE